MENTVNNMYRLGETLLPWEQMRSCEHVTRTGSEKQMTKHFWDGQWMLGSQRPPDNDSQLAIALVKLLMLEHCPSYNYYMHYHNCKHIAVVLEL